MVKKTGLIQRVRKAVNAARAGGVPVITVKVDVSAGNFPHYPTRGEFCKIIAAENDSGQVFDGALEKEGR